jgi:uncharacterized protein YjiS (DUF1127 family)
MAITTNTPTTLPLGAITTHRLVSGALDLVARFRAWNEKRRTVRILEGLSARQLDDIGLTRGDIDRMIETGRF